MYIVLQLESSIGGYTWSVSSMMICSEDFLVASCSRIMLPDWSMSIVDSPICSDAFIFVVIMVDGAF